MTTTNPNSTDYFALAKEICMKPRPKLCLKRSEENFICSRDAGHDGPHKAEGADGHVWKEWFSPTPNPNGTPEAYASVHVYPKGRWA